MSQRLFLPGAAPGTPMWQPRAAQQTAWQQAFELVAEAVGEPSIRPEAMKGDPEDAFASGYAASARSSGRRSRSKSLG
jgi:hypothetical protein